MTESTSNKFNPFPGLRPFNEEEDYLFFGREQQVAELVTLLRNQRFIAVTGTSGSGKSSLVRAGLLPELQGGMMKEVGSDWETLVLRPGGSPLLHLAEAVAEASLEDPSDPKIIGELLATLNHSGLGLVEAIRQSDIEPGTNVLILIDQFEEIFRFQRSGAANQEQAVGFVNLLLEAGAQRDIPIFVIITMRSDYLGDCTEFRGLAEAVNEGEYLIPRLTRDQIRSCIEGPIKVGGGEISFALVQELLNSLGSEQDQLPVLQHALMRSFDYWQADEEAGPELDLTHYHSVGGMETALSRHADEVFAQLDDQQQVVAKAVFKAITERGVDNRGIRRPTRLDLLTEIADADLSQVTAVVEAFRHPGVTFLMPPADLPLTPETVVDISHESLMRVWLRLKEWVDAEAQSARIYRRLTETAELNQQGRAGLYRDPDLQIAIAWRETEHPTYKWATRYAPGFEQAISFLLKSEESALAAEREQEASRKRELEQAQALAAAEAQRAESQQRAARRLRILSSGVAAVAVVACIAFVFAFNAQRESIRQKGLAEQNAAEAERAKIDAEQNAANAVESQDLAEKAKRKAEDAAFQLNETLTRSQFITAHEQLASKKNDLALAYLARSLRTKPTYWQSAAQIVSLLSSNNFPIEEEKTLEQDQPFRYWGTDESRRLIWTLSDELVGCLWDANSGTKIAELNQGKRVDWPAFTNSGELLFVALPDQGGSIVGLSVETGEAVTPVLTVSNRFNRPYEVLSRVPEETRILLDDPQARQLIFWDGKTGQAIPLPRDSQAPLVGRKYGASPDDRHVFAAFADQTISAWRASDGATVVRDFQHGLGVSDCGMSPDSRWLFVASSIQQTLAWVDLESKSESPDSAPNSKQQVFGFPIRKVAFHPEKPLMMIAGRTLEQGMLRVLDLESGEIVSEITEEEFGVKSKESIAGFRFLGMNDSEKFLKRWIVGVASQEGKQLRVYDLETGKEISNFNFDDSDVKVANFSADGSRLITTHVDRTLRIWDVFSGLPVARPIEHPFEPSFSLTADGQKVVTFNAGDMSMRVFSTRTGQQLLLPLPSVSGGFATKFRQLQDRAQFICQERTSLNVNGVSKLSTGLLSRWSARPLAARRLEQQFDGSVYQASFSPDGKQVVAGCSKADTKAKVWRVDDGSTVRTFRHADGIVNAIYSPGGDRVVTGSSDGVVRIWNLDSEDALGLEIAPGGSADFIEFNQTGDRLLIKTTTGQVGVWDAQSGFPVFDPVEIEGDPRFTSDGKSIILGCGDGILRSIDSETGEIKFASPRHSSGVAFGVHPDGNHVVTSSFGDLIRVWNLETGELAWNSPKPGSHLATIFHPQGDLVAVCNAMNAEWELGQIDLWNWRTGERPTEALECEGQVYPGAMAFSPDGRFIASGTVNGALSVWEVSTGKRLHHVRQHQGRISTVTFSADSQRLLTSGQDGAVKIYELPPTKDPIPDWLPELAELVAKKRINEAGAVESVNGGLTELKARIKSSEAQDGYTKWAKWFFSDPETRRADFSLDLSTSEFAEAKSRGSSLDDQYEAFLLQPNSGLTYCRIGYLLAVSPRRAEMELHAQSQWDQTALWYCEQGVELASEDGEAWALKAAVEQVLGEAAIESINKAMDLSPDAPIALYVQAFHLHQQGMTEEAYQAFTKSISRLPANRHSLDWENDKPFLVGTLRQILAEKDLDPAVLGLAGLSRLLQAGDTLARRKLEADWLTRYACELAPEDAWVWRIRSQVLVSLESEEELKEAIAKSLERLDDQSVDWRQYGRLLSERSDELVRQKRFIEAHEYLLNRGIPKRSESATTDQVDLTEFYNQTLVQMPYRSTTQENIETYTWKRLPIGLHQSNDVLFDVRGVIRLSGAFVGNKEFPTPLPSKVVGIPVNKKTDYLHFLHNIAANTDLRIAKGDVVGHYVLDYVDNEQRRLPIRYGQDVIPWVFNRFVKPSRSLIGWAEGRYGFQKTLCHTKWENPRPEVEIRSISFESSNSHPAPFLIAVSLESNDSNEETSDSELLSIQAYKSSFLTQGASEVTTQLIDQQSENAVELTPDNSVLRYRRAEVLYQLDKFDEALSAVQTLRASEVDQLAYRLLEGRILWKLGRVTEAEASLQRQAGDDPLAVALSADEQLIWDQFAEDVQAEMGELAGRNWLFKLTIPKRNPDLPNHIVDLSEFYNASMEESWFTPRGYANYYCKYLNEFKPGLHVLHGTPYDIRGIVQLNAEEKFDMHYPYPEAVRNINVGVKGDQLHFLHASLSSDNPGAPVLLYRIHLSNGEVHDHVARYGVDINEMFDDHDIPSPHYTAWRASNISVFGAKSDAFFFQSTWNNPTPQHSIDHVDMQIGQSRPQPFLMAMTVESFERELQRKPEEILSVVQLAMRKVSKGFSVDQTVLQHVQKIVEKAKQEGAGDPDVLYVLASILHRFEKFDDALGLVDEALSMEPSSRSDCLLLKTEILGAMNRFSLARETQKKARSAKLRELTAPRAEGVDSRMIDLSDYYNVALSEFPYQTEQSTRTLTETFDRIPRGVNHFAGTDFDVRGIVALAGAETLLAAGRYELTPQVANIAVDQKAASIHLLHGAGWVGSEPHGTCIGELMVNYEDGQTTAIKIRAGVHVRDWFLPINYSRQVSEGELAWVAPSLQVSGRDIGLYTMNWENPRPEVTINSLDYRSTMTSGAPFLAGITLGKE